MVSQSCSQIVILETYKFTFRKKDIFTLNPLKSLKTFWIQMAYGHRQWSHPYHNVCHYLPPWLVLKVIIMSLKSYKVHCILSCLTFDLAVLLTLVNHAGLCIYMHQTYILVVTQHLLTATNVVFYVFFVELHWCHSCSHAIMQRPMCMH